VLFWDVIGWCCFGIRVAVVILACDWLLCFQAIWHWMDNYPEEFTDLQKRPNDELAGN